MQNSRKLLSRRAQVRMLQSHLGETGKQSLEAKGGREGNGWERGGGEEEEQDQVWGVNWR